MKSTEVEARNLPEEVRDTVRFGLVGPLHYLQGCPSDARSTSGSRTVSEIYTATLTVYGCAPGGSGTVILRTNDGRELKRITLNVNRAPPVLTASRKTIYVGQSTMLTATGLQRTSAPM